MDSFAQAWKLVTSLDRELLQILGVTMRMSLCSTAISCCIGLPLGALLGTRRFRGKSLIKRILHTLMGLPPVVAGLVVYMLFTHYGPLGKLNMLFTVRVMVVAQCLLITPVVMALTASFIETQARPVIDTARGLGLSPGRTLGLCLSESRGGLVLATITTCFAMNCCTGDQYLSIIIPGRLYKKEFEDRKLKAKNLSRCLEDCATLTSPLIPWNVCGLTMTGFLGIPTIQYFKYAYLNLITPIVSIIYGYTGFTMEEMSEEEYKQMLEDRLREEEANRRELYGE